MTCNYVQGVQFAGSKLMWLYAENSTISSVSCVRPLLGPADNTAPTNQLQHLPPILLWTCLRNNRTTFSVLRVDLSAVDMFNTGSGSTLFYNFDESNGFQHQTFQ